MVKRMGGGSGQQAGFTHSDACWGEQVVKGKFPFERVELTKDEVRRRVSVREREGGRERAVRTRLVEQQSMCVRERERPRTRYA